MDPELIADVRRAQEASILLLTLLMEGDDRSATEICYHEEAYHDAATTMYLATLAVAAMKTLAEMVGEDPMEVVRVAGISTAQGVIDLETRGE